MTVNRKSFVVDTGVFISAALNKNSLPRRAVDWILANGILLQSIDTAAELEEVLKRPKFNKYVSEEVRLNFLAALLRETTFVSITEVITACRDPKDNKFLELAVSSSADAIISGDEDLLVLHPFRNIPILRPAEFLEPDDP